MFKRVLMLFLCLAFGVAHADPDVRQILAASDAIRNPDKPFSLTVSLLEYRRGVQVATSSMSVYSKAAPNSGRFRTLVRFQTPTRDLNKLMLKNGNDLWFYDPFSKAGVRISSQQRLLGQAANGDVLTVNLASDYKASLAKQEDIQDGDRKTRRCYLLNLVAVAPDVTYDSIDIWIEADTNRPVKARFYSESKSLLKTAYYRVYKTELGRERPTETIIIDGLDPAWVTIMRYSDYMLRELPDAWFQRDYLPNFNPGA